MERKSFQQYQKKQTDERSKRDQKKHRKTEIEIRTKHGTLHFTLFPDEMQQKQFYNLPGCTMKRSDNFSIITLEIKFK
jgi:hypothetical protein